MDQIKIKKLYNYLLKNYQVFNPQKEGDRLLIKQIKKADSILLTNEITHTPYKKFFIPREHTLFTTKKAKEKILEKFEGSLMNNQLTLKDYPKVALLGMTVKDLQAVGYVDLEYRNDEYYQKHRKTVLTIGYAPISSNESAIKVYEDKILSIIPFDIFLGEDADKKFVIFVATKKGEQILKSAGIKNYRKVEYKGYRETHPNFEKIKDKMLKSWKEHPEIWQKLGERCIECTRCVVACPICFCFDLREEARLEKGENARRRVWATCFNPDFSEVAGGYRFLNDTAKKIHFYYYHKFARSPHQEGIKAFGCIFCGRCSNVCPAGIILEDVIKDVMK